MCKCALRQCDFIHITLDNFTVQLFSVVQTSVVCKNWMFIPQVDAVSFISILLFVKATYQ